MFPTLELNVRDNDGNWLSIESLATLFKDRHNPAYTALFMHYYKNCIEPVLIADYEASAEDVDKRKVLDNYVIFLQTILAVLARKKSGDNRTCNIFTTNYDGCISYAAEEILRSNSIQFCLNDGTQGFKRRYLDAKNFTTRLSHTGVFMQHRHELPQINFIQLHGSANWRKDRQRIQVDYYTGNGDRLLKNIPFEKVAAFSKALGDKDMRLADIPKADLMEDEIERFWIAYDELPIVNPTKRKFQETVFEEHYYQMLRYLSYELEKNNSILITFGFSFADEHIRNLVRRSLSNPSLQVFIFCFSAQTQKLIEAEFSMHPNVRAISLEEKLDFTAFNEKIFTVNPRVEIPVHTEVQK